MRSDLEDRGVNLSRNLSLQDVLGRRASRRQVLAGGLGAAALGALGLAGPLRPGPARAQGGRLGFTGIPVSPADTVQVPPGYTAEVLYAWGDPISDGPAWKPDASNTAGEQAQQAGMHHDGMHLFPHPELETLRAADIRVFGIHHPSLRLLLERTAEVEQRLAPPVSVRIHGDFNTNNILLDTQLERVHFVDVHRSRSGDYIQDIGVLLVSNLRSPLQGDRVTAELQRINELIEAFAEEFARLVGDPHFRTRLSLSRARSLITSGRLVTDDKFARRIYLRGVRWLEEVVRAAA